MESNRKKDSNEQHKLDKKDRIIVALSVVLLILLGLIIILSRKRDKMIADSLTKNSEISVDSAIATVNSRSMDFLVISEINADKWIEIYNSGTDPLELSGLQINVTGRLEASIEEGTYINKNGYYVVELKSNPGKAEANVLTICDSEGAGIKSITVPKLDADKSFGLADSEKNTWGYMEASKGKENVTREIEYIKEGGIEMSAPGGFYTSSFSLELNCPEGEKIYYTIDGTRPTTESKVYDGEISIINKSGSNYVYAKEALFNRLSSGYMPGSVDAGMIVRAIRVDAQGNTVGEMSQAYFVGLSKDSDYLNIPVISITTDPENLFDYEEGIYIAGKQREDAIIQGLPKEYYANYYNPWKKKAKIEFFESTKDKTFEMDVTFIINNDQDIASRQKGLKLSIDDKLYSEYVGSSIIDFISSDGNILLTTNYNDNTIKVRNLLADSLIEGTDIPSTGCEPCVVFIDGEYWGLYTLRPYYDSKYIENTFDVKGQEIITHQGGIYNQEFDRFYEFATGTDLSVKENYEQIKTMLDVDNFIDYICLNIYLGNSSFYPSRGNAWRTVSTGGSGLADGRWRFISNDLSNTMYLSVDQTPTMNSFLQKGIQSDLLFQSLLMNDEFCRNFKSRMGKLVEEFDTEKCNEKLDETVALIKKPAMASYSRFTGSLSESTYMAETDNLRAFFEERAEYITRYAQNLAEKGGDLIKAREIIASDNEEAEENAVVNREGFESEDLNEEGMEAQLASEEAIAEEPANLEAQSSGGRVLAEKPANLEAQSSGGGGLAEEAVSVDVNVTNEEAQVLENDQNTATENIEENTGENTDG